MMEQAQQKIDLIGAMEALVYDPLGFVRFAYDWGKGQLLGEDGPDENQEKILRDIGRLHRGDKPVYIAVKSGNEVGKTALIAWIIHWFMSTHPFPQIVATANTRTQLETKTWRELAKWHGLSTDDHRDWFEWTATKFYHVDHPETWFASAIPWRKEKAQAFAGTHEKWGLMVFDESSTIDDVIWEEAEQAQGKGWIWLCVGNPSELTGRFAECFRKFRHLWHTYTIDSRTAKKADASRIKQLIETWGEDSDYVRVHVKGEFPTASMSQFIPFDLVEEARARKLVIESFNQMPIVIGVDPARFGDDQTVIYVRQGAATLEIRKYRSIDTMQVVGYVTELDAEYKSQSIFVDEVGLGAGVVDRLRQLGYRKTVGVNSGNKAIQESQYHNTRAEMWGAMREWLRNGSIPEDDQELADDLIGPEYGFDAKNRLQLERKEDMKSRGLASPDTADALALTFALPVYTKSDIEIQQAAMARQRKKFIPLAETGGY